MNILIKLTCLIGLVIAPILGERFGKGHSDVQPVKPPIHQGILTAKPVDAQSSQTTIIQQDK